MNKLVVLWCVLLVCIACDDSPETPDAQLDAAVSDDGGLDARGSDASGSDADAQVPDVAPDDASADSDSVDATADATTNAPTIVTSPPIIHLVDNLDEADGRGWCIDTVGRGLSDQLHAHSCKPSGDADDLKYRYDEASGQIRAVVYDGLCAEVVNASDPERPIGLIDCDLDNSAQRFDYIPATGEFVLRDDASLCIAVGRTSRPAGLYMARNLTVEPCATVDPPFKSWVLLTQ